MQQLLVAFFCALVPDQQKNAIRMLIENAPCRLHHDKLTFVGNQTAYLPDNGWSLSVWNLKKPEHFLSGNRWLGRRCAIGNNTYRRSRYKPFPHTCRLCLRICNHLRRGSEVELA